MRAGGVAAVTRSCARSALVPGGISPSRPATRCTCVSTGITGTPKLNRSTQLAVFTPTPGQIHEPGDGLGRLEVAEPLQVGPAAGRDARQDGLDARRLLVGQTARAQDIGQRRRIGVAHVLPGREPLAHGGVGPVAVQIARVLAQDRQHQLVDGRQAAVARRRAARGDEAVEDQFHHDAGRVCPRYAVNMDAVTDRFDRPLRDLRISVTDRCNFRCVYCMPKEVFGHDFEFLRRSQLLSFEEITRLARVFAGAGVRKLRLTGGEPLLRRDIERLIAMLAEIDGIDDIALTTNGSLLARKAQGAARRRPAPGHRQPRLARRRGLRRGQRRRRPGRPGARGHRGRRGRGPRAR